MNATSAAQEYCSAIIARNAMMRYRGCEGQYTDTDCAGCPKFDECEGRVNKARDAVRAENSK
jgi:hypothetical protein